MFVSELDEAVLSGFHIVANKSSYVLNAMDRKPCSTHPGPAEGGVI